MVIIRLMRLSRYYIHIYSMTIIIKKGHGFQMDWEERENIGGGR